MNCVKCNTSIDVDEKFCSGCGAIAVNSAPAASSFCAECRCPIQSSEKFCSECGASVVVPNAGSMGDSTRVATSVTAAPILRDKTIKPMPTVALGESASPQSVEQIAQSPMDLTTTRSTAAVGHTSETHASVSRHQIQEDLEPNITSGLITSPLKKSTAKYVVIAMAGITLAVGLYILTHTAKKPEQSLDKSLTSEVKVTGTAAESPVGVKYTSVESSETVTPEAVANNTIAHELVRVALAGNKQEFQSLIEQFQQRPLTPTGDRKSARRLNSEALKALKEQNADLAVDLLQRARVADPKDVEIGDNLAYAFSQAGRLQEAETQILTVINQAPSRMSAWFNLAETYSKLGKHQEAVTLFITSYGLSKEPQKSLEGFIRVLERSQDEGFREDLRAAIQKINQPE